MNEQIQQLISKANKLIPISRSSHHRYSQKVKHIVATLINEYKMPPKEVIKHIPVSLCSAGDWARKIKRSSFREVKLNPQKKIFPLQFKINWNLALLVISSVMQALSLILILSLRLISSHN